MKSSSGCRYRKGVGRVLAKHPCVRLAVLFGSLARGQERPESDIDLALRMKKAVGFRNLAVHNYEAINWAIVYAIARNHTADFQEFSRAVIAFRERELQGL